MQAEYPKLLPTVCWDTVNVQYPVTKFPDTGTSSETMGRKYRGEPEVLRKLKKPVNEIWQYNRDYNITQDLTQSLSNLDYRYKHPETIRHNKHTSCTENHFIYPLSRKIEDRSPPCKAHGTTEMRSAYQAPAVSSRLVTDKDQFKHRFSLPELPELEPSWHDAPEPLDTTHEGFEKLLDPYLTTSRLHHRPFTADQISRPSASKDIITYYTLANIPWVQSPKPQTDWRLPFVRPKSMYDSRTFKQECREIRTHNKLNWVPGSFRTEVGDNYTSVWSQQFNSQSEEEARVDYERSIANLPTNSAYELSAIGDSYTTETSQIGSGRPLCSVIDQYIEKNKRLERKSTRIG